MPTRRIERGVVDGSCVKIWLTQHKAQFRQMRHLVDLTAGRLEQDRRSHVLVDVALAVGVEARARMLTAMSASTSRDSPSATLRKPACAGPNVINGSLRTLRKPSWAASEAHRANMASGVRVR